MELVDFLALEAGAERCKGSSPFSPTNQDYYMTFLILYLIAGLLSYSGSMLVSCRTPFESFMRALVWSLNRSIGL